MALEETFMHENLAYLRLDEISVSSAHRKVTFSLFSFSGREVEHLDSFPSPEALGRFLAGKVYFGVVEKRPLFPEGCFLFRLDKREDCARLGKIPSYDYRYPYMGMNASMINLAGVASEADDFFKIAEGYRERFKMLASRRREPAQIHRR